MDLPVSLIISFSIFSFFLFNQQLYVKRFQGESKIFEGLLGIFAFTAMLVGLGFLIYWGYKVSLLQVVVLLIISFAIKAVWFTIEGKMGLRYSYISLSLIGFVALPVSGYFMWAALP